MSYSRSTSIGVCCRIFFLDGVAGMPIQALRGLLLRAVAPLAGLLLTGCHAVVLAPAGDLALQERDLFIISLLLLLIIVIPVIALILLFAWRYRASNTRATYTPEWNHSTLLELLIWSIPLLIIIALGALTWVSTHKLDPYRPLERVSAGQPVPANSKPLVVEVVALNWKWLFIYPEQGIATVNEMAAPVNRPIQFKITATNVMNSFFVPALAGQIYAMPGMETPLHAVINRPGTYQGISANYSGAGFSDMHFAFRGMSDADFAQWIGQAKNSGESLSRAVYRELAKPSEKAAVRRYSSVAAGLYDAILNGCVEPNSSCMSEMKAEHTHAGGMAGMSMAPPQ